MSLFGPDLTDDSVVFNNYRFGGMIVLVKVVKNTNFSYTELWSVDKYIQH